MFSNPLTMITVVHAIMNMPHVFFSSVSVTWQIQACCFSRLVHVCVCCAHPFFLSAALVSAMRVCSSIVWCMCVHHPFFGACVFIQYFMCVCMCVFIHFFGQLNLSAIVACVLLTVSNGNWYAQEEEGTTTVCSTHETIAACTACCSEYS